MQSSDGGHCAYAALDLNLSFFHHRMCNLCLGRLDPTELWHVGQLFAVGHHRCGRIDQNGIQSYFLARGLAGVFFAVVFLVADMFAVMA